MLANGEPPKGGLAKGAVLAKGELGEAPNGELAQVAPGEGSGLGLGLRLGLGLANPKPKPNPSPQPQP